VSEQYRGRHSIFSGLVLVLIGTLFLIQNFRHQYDLWDLFLRWWPLLLILLGMARLIDYLVAHGSAQSAPRIISGGDIFLIIAILALVATAGGLYKVRQQLGEADFWRANWGTPYVFTEQMPAQPVAANARIEISNVRGDISIHAEDRAEILVTLKKSISEFSPSTAQSTADATHFVVTDNHDGSYEIEPQAQGASENSDARRVQLDLEVHVPLHASVSATTQQGDIDAAGVLGTFEATTHKGNLEISDAGSDVTAETDHGDVRVTGVAGNVRLSGKGDEVSMSDVKGEADIEGEFYGPIHLSQIAKGARLSSKRTDFTLTALPGSLELDSGDLEIENSPGDANVSTQKNDVTIENVAGGIHVDDHDGDIEIRLAQPPREGMDVTDDSGDVSVTLPAKSNFQMDAESDSGDIDSEFSGIAQRKDNERSSLVGEAGTHGPAIHIRTTYGDIHLLKGS
jgi:DUF4097 and DUF4098 domain-containing protein YvlB